MSENTSVGLGLLKLLFASEREAQELTPRIVEKAEVEFGDSDLEAKVIELVEGLLLSRFPQLDREEIA